MPIVIKTLYSKTVDSKELKTQQPLQAYWKCLNGVGRQCKAAHCTVLWRPPEAKQDILGL